MVNIGATNINVLLTNEALTIAKHRSRDILSFSFTHLRRRRNMTFANNQEDEEDLHAEEDGEGVADEPGHPETKQRKTLLSAAKPVSQTQKGGQDFFLSLQIISCSHC